MFVNLQDDVAHWHGNAVGEIFYAQEPTVVAHLVQNEILDFGELTCLENFGVITSARVSLISRKQMRRDELYPAPVLIVAFVVSFKLIQNRGNRIGVAARHVGYLQSVPKIIAHVQCRPRCALAD